MSVKRAVGSLKDSTTKVLQDSMTKEQEAHLQRVKNEFLLLVDNKYRKGQLEHGGDLHHTPLRKLLVFAIDEAIDQVVYLLTIEELLLGKF